jgi:hypothetical protein
MTDSERAAAVAKKRRADQKWYQKLRSVRKSEKAEAAKRRYRDFSVAFKRQLNERRKRERRLQ